MSRGTVSRVLNGGHYVSPGTLDAVNRAIKKTGYVVNQHARSLVTQRSESVAFILSEPAERLFTDPNFAVLLRGCTQALAEHDIGLFVCIAATPSERIRVTRFLAAGHVDGALLVSAHAGDPLFKLLATAGVPAVAIGAPLGYESTIAYVAADDRGGARTMVSYLQSLPRTRVATITGPLDTSGGQQRLEGYRDVVAGSFDSTMVEPGDYTQDSGERAMSVLLERHPDLDAVFVASDVMALGALVALRRAGRRVPEDVAVGGIRRLVGRRGRPARADDHAAAAEADQRGDGASAAGRSGRGVARRRHPSHRACSQGKCVTGGRASVLPLECQYPRLWWERGRDSDYQWFRKRRPRDVPA